MAGHQFALGTYEQYPHYDYYSDFERFLSDISYVEIDDDLYIYLAHSFRWIPCIGIGKTPPVPRIGLDHFGPSAILRAGAPIAAGIFRAWADLFSFAPDRVEIAYQATIDGDPAYIRRTYLRDELVTKMRSLANSAQQVADSDGSIFMFHLGI